MPPDEIDYQLFKALRDDLTESGIAISMEATTAIAHGLRKRLREAGYAIVVDEAQALERGKLHD